MRAAIKALRTVIRKDWGETISLAADGRPITVNEVINGWAGDRLFRDAFIGELAATTWPTFFWEMPSVTRDRLFETFECAVIRSDALAGMRADESDFAPQLNATDASVVSFPNLGGDALLIAPSAISHADCYAHIGSFLREGPVAQQHELLECLARETKRMLAAGKRFWISTSGLGVPWVHLRLDSRPKYYQYRRYAET